MSPFLLIHCAAVGLNFQLIERMYTCVLKVNKLNYGLHLWITDDGTIEHVPHAYVTRGPKQRIPINKILPHNKYLNGDYHWNQGGSIIRFKQ